MSVRCVTRAGFADAMRETLVSHGEGAQGVEGRRRFFGILSIPSPRGPKKLLRGILNVCEREAFCAVLSGPI